MSPTKKPLKIGVLLANSVQLLDLSAVDLFYMTTPEYLTICKLPKPLIDQGRPCEIHYVGTSGAGTWQTCTANVAIRLTDSIHDEPVSPANLDILLIPGPDLNVVPDEEVLEYVRQHDEAGNTIISICTGIYVIGHAGLHKEKQVTGPRALIPELKTKFPGAKGWSDALRVVRDGNLWTSGGITNGHDLVAAYLQETYPDALVQTVLAMADVAHRNVEYDRGATQETLFFGWQILKAFSSSLFGQKKH